jgi:hypothetical protein
MGDYPAPGYKILLRVRIYRLLAFRDQTVGMRVFLVFALTGFPGSDPAGFHGEARQGQPLPEHR